MKRAFISVISLRILASEVCICYNRAFARIHFSFMDCHAVQAPLAMTKKVDSRKKLNPKTRIHFFKVVCLSTILRVAVGLLEFFGDLGAELD